MTDPDLFLKMRHIFTAEDGLTEAEGRVSYSDHLLMMVRDTDPATFASWAEKLANINILHLRGKEKARSHS